MPNDLENMGDSDGGDSDLEAELAALAGSGGASKPKPKPKPKLIPEKDLNNLIAESLKDIPSDEDVSGFYKKIDLFLMKYDHD
jgi:coiled-coil and C2 domain-containing protein 1